MKVYRLAAKRGLTLIELVVVMCILIALAGLVLPRLDFLKGQATEAAGAASAADLGTMLQTYRTSSGNYPLLDTLVDSTGAVASTVFSQAGTMVTATTLSGAATGGFWYQSFLNSGFVNTPGPSAYTMTTSYSSLTNGASDAGITGVDLIGTIAAGTGTVAEVVNPFASGASASPYNNAIYAAAFPNISNGGSLPVDSMGNPPKLIAMGIGPNSGLAGTVMATTPLDIQPGDSAATTYCRYLAIFAIWSDGKPAQLKMVVDHRGKTIDKRISQFNQAGPTGN